MKNILFAFAMIGTVAWWPAHGQAVSTLGYEMVSLKIGLCREVYRSGALRATDRSSAEAGDREYLQCKAGATADAKKAYSELNKSLKSKDAKKALKNYHAALMSSLESSEPRDGELTSDHRRRVDALDEKVEAAWQLLQLEM